jgi:hypothetical protein
MCMCFLLVHACYLVRVYAHTRAQNMGAHATDAYMNTLKACATYRRVPIEIARQSMHVQSDIKSFTYTYMNFTYIRAYTHFFYTGSFYASGQSARTISAGCVTSMTGPTVRHAYVRAHMSIARLLVHVCRFHG